MQGQRQHHSRPTGRLPAGETAGLRQVMRAAAVAVPVPYAFYTPRISLVDAKLPVAVTVHDDDG